MNQLKRHSVLVLCIAFVLVSAVCVAVILAPPVANVKLSGTLTLGGATDSSLDGISEGDTCSGRGSLTDVASGAMVTIYSGGSNTELQTSVLEDGKVDRFGNCVFKFSLSNISKISNYSLAIGKRPRHNYSFSQLAGAGFNLKLVLGELSSKSLAKSPGSGSKSKNYQLQDNSTSLTAN